MRNAVDLMWKSSSVRGRFEHIGILTRQAAADLGVVGPAARASGIDRDARRDFPAPLYSERLPAIAVGDAGDVFARAAALARDRKFHRLHRSGARRACRRCRAVRPGWASPQCRHCLDRRGLARRNPPPCAHRSGGAVRPLQDWRSAPTREPARASRARAANMRRRRDLRGVDPSFRNWFALATAMRGQAIMDFPLCNKSFNLSYCGHDL
jgi:hypothetical protein